jgi:hypothetical protein
MVGNSVNLIDGRRKVRRSDECRQVVNSPGQKAPQIGFQEQVEVVLT